MIRNNQSQFKRKKAIKKQGSSQKQILLQDEESKNKLETFKKTDKQPLPCDGTEILQMKEERMETEALQQEEVEHLTGIFQQKDQQIFLYKKNESPQMKDDETLLFMKETTSQHQKEVKEKLVQSNQTSVIVEKMTTHKKITSLEDNKSVQQNLTVCDSYNKNNDNDEMITQQEQQLIRETIQQEEEELRRLREQLEKDGIGNDSTLMDDINHLNDVNPLNLLQEGEKDDEVERKIDLFRHKLHGDEEELRNMRARLREEEESIFGMSYLPSTPSVRKTSVSKGANNDAGQIPDVNKKQSKEFMEDAFALKRLNTSKTGGEVVSTFSPPRKQLQQKLAPEENDFTSRLFGFMTCWSPGRKMQYYD